MPLPLRRFESAAELGIALARHLASAVSAGQGRDCLVGWPAGRTPGVVVTALVDLALAGRLDLSQVVLVLMDEYLEPVGNQWRCVQPTAHFSCLGFVRREVVGPLDAALPVNRRLREQAVWVPDPGDPDAYDERIAAAGGIDIFLVASGSSDGHVGFVPPDSDLRGRTGVVRLAQSTRQDNLGSFPGAGTVEVPTHGVSVGLGTIAAARELAVVVHGSEKRQSAAMLLSAGGFQAQWPATFALEHQNAVLWADAAALGTDSAPLSGARQTG